jgi:hypothetical protein
MNLVGSYVQIVGRIDRRRRQANLIIADVSLTPWKRRFLTESLVSNVWLDWSTFVKQVFVASCNGSLTRSGLYVAPRAVLDNSEPRIRHEIKRIYKNCLPVPGQTDSSNVEPTWAHSGKIVAYITGLSPSNAVTLQSAFGAGNLTGPKRVHLVRNACAHKSKHNRIEVSQLRSIYSTTHYLDPIDIAWGVNPVTNGIAMYEWLSDMETMADVATS